MQTRRTLFKCTLGACCAAASITTPAWAQQDVIKMVVPFPAGGVTDQAARIVAERMGQHLGQTIVIENRPGAGGRIGTDAVVKAPGDGATLLFTNSSYSILPVVDPKVSYDPLKSLTPISMSATYSLQMVASVKTPANTLGEFIAYARQRPGALSYGSAGVGSGTHFAGEFFKSLTGTFLVHIPYKSTSGALNDVAAGVLDFAIDGAARPLIDSGKVKLLAVTGDKRDPRFPNVPTAAEAGLPSFVQVSWVGVLAPASTPAALAQRLNAAANAAAADPAAQKRFADMGLLAQGGPADRLARTMEHELKLHQQIAARANLKFD